MATTNPITGDEIKSKAFSKQGRENFDKIFKKNKNMNKLLLLTASFCGPCQLLKSKLLKEGLLDKVELINMEDNQEPFKKYDIKSVPRLVVETSDTLFEVIQGAEDIIARIKNEQ
jgi:thiol-disulfide isomerase/thioredoxin